MRLRTCFETRLSALLPCRQVELVALATMAAVIRAAAAPADERLYVLNDGVDAVTAVDPATGGSATIPLGNGLRADSVALTPDGRLIYVVSTRNNAITVLEAASGRIIATIREQYGPTAVVFRPDGRFAYVSHAQCGSISAIDVAESRIVAMLWLYYGSRIAAFTRDGTRAYAWSPSSGYALYVIDTQTQTVAATLSLSPPISAVVGNPDGASLYAVRHNAVLVIDAATNQITGEVHVTGGLDQLVVAPNGRMAAATKLGSDLVTTIDLDRRRTVRFIRTHPRHFGQVVFAPDGDRAYLSTEVGVMVIDPAAGLVRGTIPGSPGDSALMMAGGSRLLALPSSGAVTVLDPNTETVVGRVTFSGRLTDASLSPDGRLVYVVTDTGLHMVDVVQASTVTSRIDSVPGQLAVSPDGRLLYVYLHASNSIAVIDAATNEVRRTIGPFNLPEIEGPPLEHFRNFAVTADGVRAFVALSSPIDGVVASYDLATGNLLGTFRTSQENGDPADNYGYHGSPRRILLSPGGETAYVLTDYFAVIIVDTATATRQGILGLADEESDAVTGFTLSRGGERLYAGVWRWVAEGDYPLLTVVDLAGTRGGALIGLPGHGVHEIAVSPDEQRAYVVQEDFRTFQDARRLDRTFVSVVDLTRDTVAETIDLPAAGTSIALSVDGHHAYVNQPALDALAVVDTQANRLESLLPVGPRPSRVVAADVPAPAPMPATPPRTVTPVPTPVAQPLAVVTHQWPHAVSMIDGGAVRTVAMGDARDVALSPDGRLAYITGWQDDGSGSSLTVLDVVTAEKITTIPLPDGVPGLIALTPDGTTAYVAVGLPYGSGSVIAVVDLLHRSATPAIAMAGTVTHMVMSADSRRVFAADYGEIAIVDTQANAILTRVPFEGDSLHAIAPAGDRLLIVNARAGLLGDAFAMIDGTGQEVRALTIDEFDETIGALAVPADGSSVVAASFAGCRTWIVVIDLQAGGVRMRIPIDQSVSAIALTHDGRFAHLAASRGVMVVDLVDGRVAQRIPLEEARRIALGCPPAGCGPTPTAIARTPAVPLPTLTPSPESTPIR